MAGMNAMPDPIPTTHSRPIPTRRAAPRTSGLATATCMDFATLSACPAGSATAADGYGVNTTVLASNTGPSTHTRFIAEPFTVSILTVHPAQPPTAQAIYSSSEI